MTTDNRKLSPREFLTQLRASVKKTVSGGSGSSLIAPRQFERADAIPSNTYGSVTGSVEQAEAATMNINSNSGAVLPEMAEADSEEAAQIESPVSEQDPTYLASLFERVHNLLGAAQTNDSEAWFPSEPTELSQTGLTPEEVERLILKYLAAKGSASGRRISQQTCLPYALIEPLLKDLKQKQLLVFKGTSTMGDYDYAVTEMGKERARRYTEECTYFGSAPVSLADYLRSTAAQTITKQHADVESLRAAFADLVLNKKMLDKLGPAINSGRGMFLFGAPGNGKTSIAERITACFGSTIWIPRALGIDGDIIRFYDPGVHELVEEANESGLFNLTGVDQRWVRVKRPTVVAGGELTMAELEVKQNVATHICEAPLQLKSNCGILVIDDFGRQRMPVAELLNRWIVPLEKRYDFLNIPCGKKIQVPFDQLIIFSTNLEPRDLVDGAFLRRIPYKIQVLDPSPDEFHQLFERIAPAMGFEYHREVVDYLIENHYLAVNRPMRACHPRDLLLQVRNFCSYNGLPKEMTTDALDFGVENYFSVM
jgi:DNA-binding PadR family transcriptional regulator